VARGSTAPKTIYTETMGLLLIPFLASFLLSPDLRRLPGAVTLGAYAVLFGSMLFLLVLGTLRDIPGMRERYRIVAAIPAVNAAPSFPGKPIMDQFVALIRAPTNDGRRGLVLDTLGPPASYYAGLHSLYHPDRIYIAPVAPNMSLDAPVPESRRPLRERMQPLRDSEPLELDGFLRAYCSGYLLLQPNSRFAAWIGYSEPDRASLHGIGLKLHELASAPWPMPLDARLRAAGVPETAPGEVVLFSYVADNCAAAAS
jgi:hypothetical protein